MPQHRILLLQATQLTAYRVGRGAIEEESVFPTHPAGQENFGSYLRQHPASRFTLLADVAEEGFLLEDIPFSSGKDRDALIRRRLGQHFHGTPFALALSEGRRKEGRRDERLLLMALTRPQRLETWLEVLRNTPSRLTGIYTVPQLLDVLLPAGFPADFPDKAIQITQTRGGLRQTFHDQGKLRFSRLTTLTGGGIEASAITTAAEAAKMHQYLAGQRLIEHDQPLRVRVLVHPAQISLMREHCRDTGPLHFEFVDLLQEARRLGLHTPLTDACADQLFCHCLARRKPRVQFAPPSERQAHRLWQTRLALTGASALTLTAGLLFSAHQLMHSRFLQHRTTAIIQQTQQDQQRYDATLQGLPGIPLSTENLRAFVDRHDQVALRAQGPAPLLIQLSQTLDIFPDIELDTLEWQITAPTETASGAAQIIATATLPMTLAGDNRAQLVRVGDFVRQLGMSPGTAATLLQPPVDTQSEKTLKSSEIAGAVAGPQEAPKFSFRLAREL